MNRQALRNPYPFHNASPRAAIRCCYRKPVRQTWLRRVLSRLFR